MKEEQQKKGSAMSGGSGVFSMIKDTFKNWIADDAFSDSASIAYYSILSLPGLLFLIVYFAGFFLGEEAVQGEISVQIGQIVGPDVASFIESIIKNSAQKGQTTFALIAGFGSVALSATAVFMQLQKVLNKIFKVKPDATKRKGFITIISYRLVSLGLIIFIGLLLLASVVIASLLTILQEYISNLLPSEATVIVFYAISILVILFLLSTFFAMIYKFLPDAKVEWKAVRTGAIITSLLFVAGAVALQYYFSLANPASAYGVAGSVILILIWAYYSSLIFLLGAEFTKVFADARYKGVMPAKYAVTVER